MGNVPRGKRKNVGFVEEREGKEMTQSDIERLRAGQRANVQREWSSGSSSVQADPDPSLRALLQEIGEYEFRRIAGFTIGLERAKARLPLGVDFLKTGESGTRASPELSSALRRACRASIAARGVEETERLIFKILSLEEKLGCRTPASSRKALAEPSVDVERAEEDLVNKHWAACMGEDWTPNTEISDSLEIKEAPSQEGPAESALEPRDAEEDGLDRHWAACMSEGWTPDPEVSDRLACAKIARIRGLEARLVGMEQLDPSSIGRVDGAERAPKDEWAPRAHDIQADQDRKAGRSVDELALGRARQESSLYRFWRAAARILGGDVPSPARGARAFLDVDCKPGVLEPV